MLQPTNAQEPDEAFKERCNAVYDGWHNGSLAFKAAVDTLLGMEQEQVGSAQYANQGIVENMLGMMYGYRGDLDYSVRHFARARDLFERAGNRAQIVRAIMNLGESYRQKGDFPRARQFFRTAYEQANVINEYSTAAYAAANEGHLLLSMNQLASAKERFEKALELVKQEQKEETRDEVTSDCDQGLATYYLRVDERTAAWRCALESLQLSQKLRQPFMLGFAYRTMGEVLTAVGYTPSGTPRIQPAHQDDAAATNEHLGDPDMYFQLAVDAFSDIKAEGELARTVFMQGQSLMARGQRVTASRKFHQAMLIFTKLGMRDDANKAAQAQMNAIAR